MIKFLLLTLAAGLILTLLPLPYWAQNFRPLWLLLVTLCWILIYPEKIGVGFAWLNGLLLDALQGTLLGEHAFCFALTAYVLIKIRRWFSLFPMKFQMLGMFFLLMMNQITFFWLEGLQGHHIPIPGLLGSVVSSVIFWMWVYKLFLNILHRYPAYGGYRRSSHEYS